MSMPSLESEPTPNLPMVKAMAPKAPIGAAFMMMPTTPKKAWETLSMKSIDRLAFFAHGREGEAEEEGEQQHLEDVSLGEGVHHAGGDDVHQEIDGAVGLCLRW